VVILSIVRTYYSIDKDFMNQPSFYVDSQILNSAFTRVQSLIVTAAHPLSLITRGHVSCRLFWASYLSYLLSKAECKQLKREFISECRLDEHKQLNPEDYEVCCTLIKEQENDETVSTDNDPLIVDDLGKQYGSNDD